MGRPRRAGQTDQFRFGSRPGRRPAPAPENLPGHAWAAAAIGGMVTASAAAKAGQNSKEVKQMDQAPTAGMPAIEDIIDNFSLLDEWDDRYRYVIELGRSMS